MIDKILFGLICALSGFIIGCLHTYSKFDKDESDG